MIRSRSNVKHSAYRWDGSTIENVINNQTPLNNEPIAVPYYFDGNLPEKYREMVLNAISDIEEAAPGIRFYRIDTSRNRNHIRIVYGKNCQSSVGMGRGEQKLILANWAQKGNALHELMHALGFVHEHQREDRDKYVQCMIEDDVNYNIEGWMIGRYDADSIMHYPTDDHTLVNHNLWAFSQRDHLSNGDKIALNKLYPPVAKVGTWYPKKSVTGLYYCGKHNMANNNAPFGKIGGSGFCGPNKGPNCHICRHYAGIQSTHNDEGRKATQGETGLFYCGKQFRPKQAEQGQGHDGICGPNNGPNCESCSRLLD